MSHCPVCSVSISDDECTLEVFDPDGCCYIVGGLALADWEKGVVWDVSLGVSSSITASHNNNNLVVTVFVHQGKRSIDAQYNRQ